MMEVLVGEDGTFAVIKAVDVYLMVDCHGE
jgi:hypothetical protein